MRIFLAGATGYVGSRVLHDALAAKHSVTALTRSHRSAADLLQKHPDLSVAIGDVADRVAIERLVPNSTDAIIYLPGLLREFPNKGITFRAVHVDGPRNLMAAAEAAGATRWIEMSALGVSPGATTPYFQTKWEAEEYVRASAFEWTILRPSVIFDEHPSLRPNFVGEIVKILRLAPVIPILGDGTYRLQPVSLDDVSQTIVQALMKPESIGKTYEMGGPEKLRYSEIVRILLRAMGKSKPSIHIPFALAEFAARFLDRFQFFPFTRDQLAMLREENIVHDPTLEREWLETFQLPMKRFEPSVRKLYTSEDV